MERTLMTNPLLERHDLPPFSQIKPEHVEPAVDELLARSREAINTLVAEVEQPTWDNFVAPMEAIADILIQAWSPVSHMNAVVNTDALRDAYNACLPKLSEFWTELGLNKGLYTLYEKIASSAEFQTLSGPQQKVIEDNLRDFKLSGIALPEAQQGRYGEIQKRLSELTSKFSENVLDATGGWSKLITDKDELAGLPDSAIAAAAQMAEAKGETGYLITLDFPSYMPIVTYAQNRELRQEVYTAFCTRASEQGPQAGQWDNSELMKDILTLRLEKANLLGFANYAEYSLATKMAETPQQVIDFLDDLAEKSKPEAEQDYQALSEFAAEQGAQLPLQAWDITYYSEKLKEAKYSISQEMLRPYFPFPKVVNGMFSVAQRLFGIDIQEETEFDTWHKDARLFTVSRAGEQIAQFYLDPYAREKKRGGAWMDGCRTRRKLADGAIQLPVAYLVCNFNAPVGNDPALLTHNEVTTLFHEFGHGIHHMLTQIDCADVSGINGVAWDAVELPSQFMENWCYEPEALALISGHYQTGELLPEDLLNKMLAAKNFQSGMMMMRQLEFSLFDFHLHKEFTPGETDVQAVLNRVRDEVAVVQVPEFNRFQHGFTHIFAGGYAAGYYSYKWAEVLSADAFSRFEEEGIFNPETGADFLHNILEKGGSQEAMDLFVAFRGRKPTVDALLRHSGITVTDKGANA
jgi:oligopeptidase A